jgi:hypothetical protein
MKMNYSPPERIKIAFENKKYMLSNDGKYGSGNWGYNVTDPQNQQR